MVEWITSDQLIDYQYAIDWMESRANDIAAGRAGEAIWLLEHPPLYTAGTSARAADLIEPHRFPVYATRRGGQYTYHGPGQRVVYVMLDLNKRGKDVRAFVQQLERGLSRPWIGLMSAAKPVRAASGYGLDGTKGRFCPMAAARKIKLLPLAYGCENGCLFTVFRSMSSPICHISMGSCPAAFTNTGSPA